MAKDLKEALVNQKTKLGGAEKPYMDLGGHLEYIESLLEGGAGGGGKSVPPTLNLFDFENGKVRTTITEEEYNNLKNGLYNQVVYISRTDHDFMAYTPSKLMSIEGMYSFTAMDGIVEKGEQVSCTTISLYSLDISEKNTSGEYPITIQKSIAFNLGGNSGGSSGGNIWYDLTSLNGNSITQEQYNEIKSLIDSNSLAGIKTVLQFFPLVSENNGEFKFAIFSKSYEQIDSNKKLEIDNIYFIIKPDLSITNTWDTTPVVELTKNLSSQSIPSIKTDGYQQNLTIGDGLKIENGALKATGGGSGGGIPTASINTQTFQLDTSSLTAKDNYVIASMDGGGGNISYVPLQTYFFNDGYFNKEVKMQTSSHDFRLSLTSVAFQSHNNYTLKGEVTNIDFTNTLDSTNTWTKLGDIKYIAIEEKNALTEESSHKYLEISGVTVTFED